VRGSFRGLLVDEEATWAGARLRKPTGILTVMAGAPETRPLLAVIDQGK
jgi:hypothetical protein